MDRYFTDTRCLSWNLPLRTASYCFQRWSERWWSISRLCIFISVLLLQSISIARIAVETCMSFFCLGDFVSFTHYFVFSSVIRHGTRHCMGIYAWGIEAVWVFVICIGLWLFDFTVQSNLATKEIRRKNNITTRWSEPENRWRDFWSPNFVRYARFNGIQ